jgi:predicted transcriptional regulator
MAAILKIVFRGEGSKRDIGRSANLSFLQTRQYLMLLLEYDLLIEYREKEAIYKITQKAIYFLKLYDQLNSMMQHTRGTDELKSSSFY